MSEGKALAGRELLCPSGWRACGKQHGKNELGSYTTWLPRFLDCAYNAAQAIGPTYVPGGIAHVFL